MGKDQRELWRALGVLSTIGTVLAASIFLCFWAGYALDRWLGTLPLFTVIGIVLGIVAGFWEVMRIIRRFARNF